MKNIKKNVKSTANLSLFILFLLILLSSSTPTALPIDQIFNEDFNNEIENKMDVAHVPSCAISIINKSEVVFEKGYGDQPELNTVYPLYSINKPLVAVAILQLYEDGILDLDEDINSYLPFIVRNPNWPSTPITCKHLLSHQSSLKDRFNETYMDIIFNSTFPFPDYIYELINENGTLYSTDLWYDFQPGTGSAYSSLDFDILAYIIELQTGETIHDYLEENIFIPLGMQNTKTNWTDFIQARRAIPYVWSDGTGDYEQLEWIDLGCAMDYKTTIQDLSKLLIILMNDGVYDSLRILEKNSIDLMLQNHGDEFGFGLFVNTKIKQGSNEKGYYGHIGVGLGYVLNMYFKNDIGVIFFANQCDEENQALFDIMPIYHYIFDQAFKIKELEIEETNYNVLAIVTLVITISSLKMLVKKRKFN